MKDSIINACIIFCCVILLLQKTDVSLIRQSGERSKWSIEEKEYLQQFVATSLQEDDESDNSYWARCAKTINLRFPNSMRTGKKICSIQYVNYQDFV